MKMYLFFLLFRNSFINELVKYIRIVLMLSLFNTYMNNENTFQRIMYRSKKEVVHIYSLYAENRDNPLCTVLFLSY